MPKKPKWPKLPRFLIPLFHSANVYLCTSRDEWENACVALGVDPNGVAMLGGVTASFQNPETAENFYLMGVFTGRLDTLVHECAHIAFYTCRDVGVTIDPAEANETYCYLLDKLFSHFQPFVENQK